MSERSESNSLLDPFGLLRDLRNNQLDTWSKAMLDLVSSEAYTRALFSALETYLTGSAPYRQMLEKAMLQTLQQAQMPSRADVTSLAERLTHIEFRLDDLDAALADLRRPVAAPPAPVAAPETTAPATAAARPKRRAARATAPADPANGGQP